MRLEGSLDAFSLPDIFSLLAMTKKTGGLQLRRDGVQGIVWFTDGAITGGSSDLSRAGLARRFAGSGEVSDSQLEQAVDLVADQTGIAQALRDADVDEALLQTIVAEHVVDTVFDLLRWPEGDFGFELDQPNPDDVGVSRPVDEVVSEARSRLESWTGVAERVPSSTTVMSLVLAPDDDPQLTRDEWALLAFVDGTRTVADVVSLSGRGEYTAVCSLAELVSRGLISADGEGISAQVRRQQILATLEATTGRTTVITQANDHTEAPATTRVDVDMTGGQPAASDTADGLADPDGGGTEGGVAPLTMVSGSASGDDAVTPQRPEPFLPPRRPEHPEPMAAVAGGGATAALSAAIERDPSVNKSMLLRLIAGVRGL